MTDLAPPVVSLAGMRSGDAAARAAVADAMRAACLDKGFLYIVDHGVAPATMAGMFAQARRFFALPDARKAEVDMGKSPNQRGWEPMRRQTTETGTPPDVKEGFYTGNELAADDPRVVAGLFNHGPNQWPADLPGFRETLEAYFTEMEDLCRLTMRALALALHLPEDHFEPFCDGAVSNLKLLHYPPQPADSPGDSYGSAPHTDYGLLTVLAQDDTGGLEVRSRDGVWLPAPPVPETFVVNVADMLARWTNGRWQSTPHRVRNLSGGDRYSAPYFFDMDMDSEVACLPSCTGPGAPPLDPPVRYGDYLMNRLDRNYAYRQQGAAP